MEQKLNLQALESESINRLKGLNDLHARLSETWDAAEDGDFDEVNEKTLDEAKKISDEIANKLEVDNPQYAFASGSFDELNGLTIFCGKISDQLDGEWRQEPETHGGFTIDLDGEDYGSLQGFLDVCEMKD